MNGQLAFDDCTPDWPDEEPNDPTLFGLRQAEMQDLRGQGPGPAALWTATTINSGEYL